MTFPLYPQEKRDDVWMRAVTMLQFSDLCWEGAHWVARYPTPSIAWRSCMRPDWMLWALEHLLVRDYVPRILRLHALSLRGLLPFVDAAQADSIADRMQRAGLIVARPLRHGNLYLNRHQSMVLAHALDAGAAHGGSDLFYPTLARFEATQELAATLLHLDKCTYQCKWRGDRAPNHRDFSLRLATAGRCERARRLLWRLRHQQCDVIRSVFPNPYTACFPLPKWESQDVTHE